MARLWFDIGGRPHLRTEDECHEAECARADYERDAAIDRELEEGGE